MGAIEDRLAELGSSLPAPLAAPAGVRLPFELVRVHGGLAYVSGHGPFDGDRLLVRGASERGHGRAGVRSGARDGPVDARVPEGRLGRARPRDGLGEGAGLRSSARRASTSTPAAINGFSDLILDLWGNAGRHARSAIGAGELPFGMPVEVEAIATVA